MTKTDREEENGPTSGQRSLIQLSPREEDEYVLFSYSVLKLQQSVTKGGCFVNEETLNISTLTVVTEEKKTL